MDPLHGGGMPSAPIDVAWTIARDEAMKDVAASGSMSAIPELGHSVHVDANGLEPDRAYWYRFRAGGFDSPIGRTRTAPAASASPEVLKFAFASCQN
jgi:alkaline phosphatase D